MSKIIREVQAVKNQQKQFEKLLNKINNTKNTDDKIDLACIAAKCATYKSTGYYYSTKLEKVFTDYAKSIKVEIKKEYKPNTYLHVLTKAYKGGGHTRVVEKWIEQGESSQVHSVICINQDKEEINEKLKNAINKKNGKLILLENEPLKEKAIKLRQIASQYEYIILHTHMEDPTALIAFGTEDFKRPVIFYNHADHMFWLGKSIIDILATLREYSDEITIPKRNIHNSFKIGVPIEVKRNIVIDKIQAKEKLGISIDKKVIITAGGSHKFKPLADKSILDYLYRIVNNQENAQIYVIGPSPIEEMWADISIKSKEKIKVLGELDYNGEYFDYINAADLVIDSWPMSGGTVMIDAISCNTPVISLKNPLGQFDYLAKSAAYCKTEEEFYEKTKKILNDENFRNNLLSEVQNNLHDEQSEEIFREKLKKLIELTPNVHRVKDLSNETENKQIDDAVILLNYIYNKHFLKKRYDKLFVYLIIHIIAKYILKNRKISYKYLMKYYSWL